MKKLEEDEIKKKNSKSDMKIEVKREKKSSSTLNQRLLTTRAT